jgi:hypothetical protein
MSATSVDAGETVSRQCLRGGVVPSGYGEGLNDARTPLADFFSILLLALPRHQMDRAGLDRSHHGNT